MTRSVVVVGDTLFDRDVVGNVTRVCADAPVPVVDVVADHARPGGAGLAAALAAHGSLDVTLVTALARDEEGARLRRRLEECGVSVVAVPLDGSTPQKVRVRAHDASLLRLDIGGGRPDPAARIPRSVFDTADAVLVADYGQGMAALEQVRAALAPVARRTPVVWDPHPRGPAPIDNTQLLTPNERELGAASAEIAAIAARARTLARNARAAGVAVTLGARGALLVSRAGPPLVVPVPHAAVTDTCGAGDAFAAAATSALANGAVLSEAVEAAVASASAFVAAGGAAAFTEVSRRPPVHRTDDAAAVVAQTRACGGTVVATGGCFDVLHAGHLSLLRAARKLGDCLVVLLNSDASVRRLKGADRPFNSAADRAAILGALECVDAVEVFDDDTPVAALERLRPDVFAKGGDYALGHLPEVETMRPWGGEVVVLPYLPGHSTTRLLEEVAHRAHQ